MNETTVCHRWLDPISGKYQFVGEKQAILCASWWLLFFALSIGGLSTPALAEAAQTESGSWSEVSSVTYKSLLILFVSAILLESALDVIFNWRPFLQYVNLRVAKPIIMIGVSALAVGTFGIDTVNNLMHAYFPTAPSGAPEITSVPFWFTALILAGGSKGIYNLLKRLGYREDLPDPTQQKFPDVGKAWVSIRVNPNNDGQCFIAMPGVGADPKGDTPVLVGAVRTAKARGSWFRTLFLRDYKRWPPSGGQEVETAKEYTFNIFIASDMLPKLNPNAQPVATIGPFRFADRAIIDFYVDV